MGTTGNRYFSGTWPAPSYGGWLMLRVLFSALLMAFLVSETAQAQTEIPAALIADHISFDRRAKILTAKGTVEVYFNDARLTATQITYDQQNDHITAHGPIALVTDNDTVILADFAELDADFKNAVLSGARLVLSGQLQIAAVELARVDGRYSQLYQSVASTCHVCAANPVPLWQIRAKRIVHDSETHLIHFEQAQFLLGNTVIFQAPRMRFPDPTVTRTSGFLAPKYKYSSTLGNGLLIPYFATLGDHADLLLAPFVTSGGSQSLTFRYRQRFAKATLDVEGALSRDTLTTQAVRGYLFANSRIALGNGFNLAVQSESASDLTYLSQYGLAPRAQLESHVLLNRQTEGSFFDAGAYSYKTLGAGASDATKPTILTEAIWRRQTSGVLGGFINTEVRGASYQRKSKVDGASGRDAVRLSGRADWSRDWISTNGLVSNFAVLGIGQVHKISDDSAFANTITRTQGIAALTLRWPLERKTNTGRSTIEPIFQLVAAPSAILAIPNEDSTFIELDKTNLISLDRFGGMDATEQGTRANLGVRFGHKAKDGLDYSATIGAVLSTQSTQFTGASGLGSPRSNFLLAVDIGRKSRWQLSQQILFASTKNISRNETRLDFTRDKFDVATTYLWKDADATSGTTVNRSELNIASEYRFDTSWKAIGGWRHNFVAGQTSNAALGLRYETECISVDLSVSRRFSSATSAEPNLSIGLEVNLLGISGGGTASKKTRHCSNGIKAH
jgi:LPS-assembly protein